MPAPSGPSGLGPGRRSGPMLGAENLSHNRHNCRARARTVTSLVPATTAADRAVSRTRGPGRRRGLIQVPCNFAGPRSAPTATPADAPPRGHAGRVDDAARLECQAANPATYLSSPGPEARRRGRMVLRSVRDGRMGRDPSAPAEGECRQVCRSKHLGPPTGGPGAGAHQATRTGHLGQTPKGYALAEPAEESGAIKQRGQWWPRGWHTACTVWGNISPIQVEAAVRQPGRGLLFLIPANPFAMQ